MDSPIRIRKKKISITIEDRILEELKEECDVRTMKLSNYIEKLIKLGKEKEKQKLVYLKK